MSNKVSIIIPTYNGENHIKETIDSCLNQSYLNIEIIVLDDCSTDSTVEILKQYDDKIILYLNKINQGIVKNVNKGVSLSSGDYFIFLGHDDILPENHVEIMLNEFNENTVAVVCGNMGIDSNGKKTKLAQNDDIQIQKISNIMFELSIDNFISSCGMMHRTDIFQKLGGWDGSYKNYGEWLYYIKILKYGKIKYTTKTKALYRTHETNITKTFINKDIKQSLNNYKNHCRKIAHELNDNTLSENIKYYLNKFKLLIRFKEFKSIVKNIIQNLR